VIRLFLNIFLIGFSSLAFAQSNSLESWPNRPIRIITTDPGGAADIAARLIAPTLSKVLVSLFILIIDLGEAQ